MSVPTPPNQMYQPNSGVVTVVNAINYIQKYTFVVFIFGLLDTLGGGPDILTQTMLFVALGVFIGTRFTVMSFVGLWLHRSGIDGVYKIIVVWCAIFIVVGAGIYLTYQHAMAPTMVSLSLASTTFSVIMYVATDYEYEEENVRIAG